MSGPRIEIVTPGDGWVCDRLGAALLALEGTVMVQEASGQAALTYFLPYSLYQPVTSPTAAYFTHREPEGHGLHDFWSHVGEMVDRIVTMNGIRGINGHVLFPHTLVEKVRTILPFIEDHYLRTRLVVGVAGLEHQRNETRKGVDLVERLEGEPWAEVRRTRGKLSATALRAWWQEIDVYLVASRNEGGPMGAVAAVAQGIPVVMPRIGLYAYLPGVHSYPVGDYEAMVATLRKFHEQRVWMAEHFGRAVFVEQHRQLFEELLAEKTQEARA